MYLLFQWNPIHQIPCFNRLRITLINLKYRDPFMEILYPEVGDNSSLEVAAQGVTSL